VALALKAKMISQVRALEGGLVAWRGRGLPTTGLD
jgi:rhodanese-related sulfurtransferase